MPERKSHPPGSFCFIELVSADTGKAAQFLADVLGWEIREVAGGFYSLAHWKGKAVAGLCALSPEMQAAGVPPHWMSYVRVEGADAAAARAAELGGTVAVPPFDVPTVGRMAVVQDPTGATLALWEARGMEGFGLADEPGSACWWELMSPDTAKAAAFYTALFGWTAQPSKIPLPSGDAYTEFKRGDAFVAGMMPVPAELRGRMPAHWVPYVAVEDCDATAKAAAENGGKVCHPPSDIPGVGRFSILDARAGGAFGVIRLGT